MSWRFYLLSGTHWPITNLKPSQHFLLHTQSTHNPPINRMNEWMNKCSKVSPSQSIKIRFKWRQWKCVRLCLFSHPAVRLSSSLHPSRSLPPVITSVFPTLHLSVRRFISTVDVVHIQPENFLIRTRPTHDELWLTDQFLWPLTSWPLPLL